MNSKGTGKLAIIFLILLAVTVVMKIFGGRAYETGETAQAQTPMFDELRADQIATLTITGPGDAVVELKRQGEYWQVASKDGFRADADKVGNALDDLVTLKRGKDISDDPDLPEFGLAGEDAIHVEAQDSSGDELLSLIIGKTPDYNTAFIQREEESAVRKVDSSIRTRLEVRGGWRDKTVIDSGSEESVETITIQGPAERIVLVKEEETVPADGEETTEVRWQMTEPLPGAAVEWQCSSMARALTDLKCEGFYEGDKSKAELGLDPPKYTLTAEHADAESVLLLGNKEGEQYAVTVPGEDTVWLIPAFRAEYFIKNVSEYLQTPPGEETEDGSGEGAGQDSDPQTGETAPDEDAGVSSEDAANGTGKTETDESETPDIPPEDGEGSED